jgi:hypothetical protein
MRSFIMSAGRLSTGARPYYVWPLGAIVDRYAMPKWNDVRRWRERAEECRALAETMRNRVAAEKLLNAAAAYDRMVAKAEAAEAGRTAKKER